MSKPDRHDLTKFPLLKLPFLATKNAVKHMGILDIYKFSTSSKVSGSLVRLMKLKTEGINVHAIHLWGSVGFQPIDSLFEPDDEDSLTREHVMKRMPIQFFYNSEEDIFPDIENNYPKEEHVVPDCLEGCLGMAEQLNQIFEFKTCTYDLSLLNKEPEEWMQILSRVLAHKCTYIHIHERKSGKRIDRDVLDYLMDNLSPDARLIINANLPENYTHQNLFKFQHFSNNKTSWVTMDLLKSLRNVKSLSFTGMNFDSKDINEFLRYFINCEKDILEGIRMVTNWDNELVEEEILDQLITVSCFDYESESTYHLMKVRHPNKRKSVLMKLEIFRQGINLETIKDIEPCKMQFKTLELKEKEKDLEKELGDIKDLEKRSKGGPSNDEKTLKELMERREAILMELTEIRMKLLHLRN